MCAVQILTIFHNINFFMENYFFFLIKILFAVFNVLFVGYALAKNNLNNTYQYNVISKKFSKTMNYLIILIKFKVSRFLCRSVYLTELQVVNPANCSRYFTSRWTYRKKLLEKVIHNGILTLHTELHRKIYILIF
jgi:hypothetical protein